MQWVLSRTDCVLCIRPRAGEDLPVFPADPRIVLTGQDWPLASLLHATDLVVTLTSTVGLEGHLAGCRLIQVLGSVFDQAMPLARYGIADAAVPVAEISQRWNAGSAPPVWPCRGRYPRPGRCLPSWADSYNPQGLLSGSLEVSGFFCNSPHSKPNVTHPQPRFR
jgi:hypothetical protein